MKEIEVKVIDIDVKQIKELLINLNAKKLKKNFKKIIFLICPSKMMDI